MIFIFNLSLRKKCPYSEFFWSVFSRIQSECGKIRTRKTPNADNIHAVCNTFEDLHQGQNEEKFYKILSTWATQRCSTAASFLGSFCCNAVWCVPKMLLKELCHKRFPGKFWEYLLFETFTDKCFSVHQKSFYLLYL